MTGQFPDVMVDIETSGTDPSRTAMIQLAAVRFNIEEGTIDTSSFFKQSLAIPPGRFWDEETRKWWYTDKRALLEGIQARARPPKDVMVEFQQWIVAGHVGGQPTRFWSKPQSFDWPFVDSYFQQFEMANPMSFREAVDMRTYCRTVLGTWNLRDIDKIEKGIPFQGAEHDALMDAIHQIRVVLTVREMAHNASVM